MKGLIIVIFFVLAVVVTGMASVNREARIVAGFSMPGKQKADRKKSKKAQSGMAGLNPGNPGMLIDAKKEAIIGNLQGAQEMFRHYVNRYPEDPVGYYELARIESMQKNMDESIRLCREATRLDPGNIWYSLFLAELYQGVSRPKDAIDIYEKIVDKDADNLDYLYNSV